MCLERNREQLYEPTFILAMAGSFFMHERRTKHGPEAGTVMRERRRRLTGQHRQEPDNAPISSAAGKPRSYFVAALCMPLYFLFGLVTWCCGASRTCSLEALEPSSTAGGDGVPCAERAGDG